jgi:hypothetical protein
VRLRGGAGRTAIRMAWAASTTTKKTLHAAKKPSVSSVRELARDETPTIAAKLATSSVDPAA